MPRTTIASADEPEDWWEHLPESDRLRGILSHQTRTGIIAAYVHTGGRIGALVDLRCETEFVARTDDFRLLANDLAMQVTAMAPRDIGSMVGGKEEANETILLNQPFIKNPAVTIRRLIFEHILKLSENILVQRLARFEVGDRNDH